MRQWGATPTLTVFPPMPSCGPMKAIARGTTHPYCHFCPPTHFRNHMNAMARGYTHPRCLLCPSCLPVATQTWRWGVYSPCLVSAPHTFHVHTNAMARGIAHPRHCLCTPTFPLPHEHDGILAAIQTWQQGITPTFSVVSVTYVFSPPHKRDSEGSHIRLCLFCDPLL